ncbi:rRNA N6-adenosine-methyltransferase ZCCHC4-like [Liolophura sinensis]|uniref:rRNA N6-adenosine-methyltransferase ZCCHC4-like n=1 Tax=Liolophura sinensis TaxID=3198878 RepID=UPI003158665F
MSHRSGGVDVIVESVGDSPFCPHGPMLMFEKFCGTDSKGRRFYACSAFRDRKDCNFFQWADEKISPEKQLARDERHKQLETSVQAEGKRNRRDEFKNLPPEERALCQTCGKLLLPAERNSHGDGHRVISPVTNDDFKRPTSLFVPLENNKTYAQYLFGGSSVKFTIDTVRRLGFTKLLCVGTPRIHEEIQNLRESPTETLKSLLLDLDHRFEQIWPPELFCRYNMFNHYFFHGRSSEEAFHKFVSKDADEKLIILMDPPFGGMVEALASTLKKISEAANGSKSDVLCPMFWYFPYFMEKRILEACPGLTMLDYKVDYDNHSLFHAGDKGRKEGSPVRIFTNLPPSKVVLPKTEGYWFCKKCLRYSAPENWHCQKCGSCTSKDGKSYVHCDLCGRCVKPSRVHCEVCQQCELADHRCGAVNSTGCHVCGALEHKRRDCPNKSHICRKIQKRLGEKMPRKIRKSRRK